MTQHPAHLVLDVSGPGAWQGSAVFLSVNRVSYHQALITFLQVAFMLFKILYRYPLSIHHPCNMVSICRLSAVESSVNR